MLQGVGSAANLIVFVTFFQDWVTLIMFEDLFEGKINITFNVLINLLFLHFVSRPDS